MNGTDAVPDLSACCPTCGPEAPLPSACSLAPEGLDGRLAEIRALARRALLSADREGLALRLVYRPDARAEIADLVAREAQCCGFLGFRVEEERDRLFVTVTAPGHAEAAARELFDAFEGRTPRTGAPVAAQPPEMAGDG